MIETLNMDLIHSVIMSHIIANPHVEDDMTDKFICTLYYQDRNRVEVRNNGVDPFDIWNKLHYNAYDQLVVPIILNRLISNNKNRGLITYNSESRTVLLTEEGRLWGELNCSKIAVF